MEIKESYRVLELEVGATQEAIEAAYCRLLERWHPDRVAAGGPDAEREAQRMVQTVNDAYQTLIKIAPGAAQAAAPAPTNAPPPARAKPTLPPWPASQPTSPRLPPPPPSAPPPAPPPTKPLPPTPAASAPAPAPAAKPAATPPVSPGASPTPPAEPRSKALVYYDLLFPVGAPRRRFGPLILAGAVGLLVLLVAMCSSKSPEQIKAAKVELEARTTGRLAVKSNRANTTIEATLIPAAGEAASAVHKGSADGAAEQAMTTLPPGKYAFTARSEGWPDINQEVTVEAGRATEVTVRFKTGSLRVESLPTGATVKLGPTVLGKTPLVVPQLPPGEVSFTLEYPLWPVGSFKTTIAENGEAAETVRLPHGKLVIESTPAGATVLFGKRPIGQTPLTIERYQAGNTKLTLQAKDFPPMELAIAMEDRGEVKLGPLLAWALPELDPAGLLGAVWVETPPDDPNRIAPPLQSLTGYPSRNGIVKNLNRKKLAEAWLDKRYRFLASVKAYNRESGLIEFTEEKGTLARYRVLAKLSAAARNDKDLPALLVKGAMFTLYGYLTAVEEPAWPARVISIEISEAEPLR